MTIDEAEIHITPDGFGRAAIVRREDGLFCIYVHWIWPNYVGSGSMKRDNWMEDETPPSLLYKDVDPEPGVYGSVEDARRQVRSLRGFSETIIRHPN